jgi:predicted ester cyclase
MTTSEEAKAIIRRWNDEGWSGGNYQLAYELIAPVMTVHGAGGQAVGMGPDGLIGLITAWRTAFPDGRMAVDELIVDGDLVAIRNTWRGTQQAEFYGVPASGKTVEVTSIGIDRVVDDRVCEGWGELDMIGMMQTLGAMPLTGPGAVATGRGSGWGPSRDIADGSPVGAAGKELLTRFVDALAAGDSAAVTAITDAGFVDHNPTWGTTTLEEVLATAAELRAALPDLTVTIESDIMISEGDRVAAHSIFSGTHTGGALFGIEATGKPVSWTHNDFVRIADGKIIERYVASDTLTLTQQLAAS